jgi:hypothetical protein
MAKLYREHILGEKPADTSVIPLSGIAPAKAKQEEKDLVSGD